MAYIRVIPRDLFNEGDLLKCLGGLKIQMDNLQWNLGSFDTDDDHVFEAFDIRQNELDGSISVANLPFNIGGETWVLYRPLNSRGKWPLYAVNCRGEEEAVFQEDGTLTMEFKERLTGTR